MGPDSKRIIFNCKEPAINTDILKQMTSLEELTKFTYVINTEFEHTPNTYQLAAAVNTYRSESGCTVIVGPPGTGKTKTI